MPVVADFRSGKSHCHHCSSDGSLSTHAAGRDPENQLMACTACGACFWISRAEYERLMYRGPLVLPEPARVKAVTL